MVAVNHIHAMLTGLERLPAGGGTPVKSKGNQTRKPRSVRSRALTRSPQDRRLLAFIKRLRAEPDQMGDVWWDEFRDFLRKHPVRLGNSIGD
jgi:hypothetical protein